MSKKCPHAADLQQWNPGRLAYDCIVCGEETIVLPVTQHEALLEVDRLAGELVRFVEALMFLAREGVPPSETRLETTRKELDALTAAREKVQR